MEMPQECKGISESLLVVFLSLSMHLCARRSIGEGASDLKLYKRGLLLSTSHNASVHEVVHKFAAYLA